MKKKTCKIIICVAMFMLIFSSFTSIFADTNPDYTPKVQVADNTLDAKIKGSVLLDALANMINAIASLAEFLIGAIFSALTGDNIFPWADRIIFNGIGFLDINFLNPASNSLFRQNGEDSILGQVVKSVYSTVFSLAVLFLGVAVGVMAIRLAISSIAAEKAKYKQAIVNWATCIVMLFLMHYILAFAFWVNEQLVRLASGILIQTIESRGLNSVDFSEALSSVVDPETRVKNFIDTAYNPNEIHVDNIKNNPDIANAFLTSKAYVDERLVYVYDNASGNWEKAIAQWFSMQGSMTTDIGLARLAYDVVDAKGISDIMADTTKDGNGKTKYQNQMSQGYFELNNAGDREQIIFQPGSEKLYKSNIHDQYRKDLAMYLVLANMGAELPEGEKDELPDGSAIYDLYKDNPGFKLITYEHPNTWDRWWDTFTSITTVGLKVVLIDAWEGGRNYNAILNNYTVEELEDCFSESQINQIVSYRMKCDSWIINAAQGKNAVMSSTTDIIASLGSFFKQSAYVYTTKQVGTNDEGNKEVITGWRASEISVTGALLYAIFIFQSCMYLLMYVKRLFYVMMLSMFGPIVVIYDFFVKSAGS